MKILELKQNIFKENEVTADKIREEFKKQKKLMINVMSSPGSGKTTTLLRTIERLQGITRIGVMECDIDASVDAVTIEMVEQKPFNYIQVVCVIWMQR